MEFSHDYTGKTSFDLQDFNDYRLSAAGELAILPEFHKPIRIEVGDDELELTNISLPKDEGEKWHIGPKRLFILRNLSSTSPAAHLVMDNEEKSTDPTIYGGRYEVKQRKTYIIGRGEDASPQLDLSASVSRRHLQIRLGNMAGNLHFADLDSKNGTIVKIHEEDLDRVSKPRREFKRAIDGYITYEQDQQRWSR